MVVLLVGTSELCHVREFGNLLQVEEDGASVFVSAV